MANESSMPIPLEFVAAEKVFEKRWKLFATTASAMAPNTVKPNVVYSFCSWFEEQGIAHKCFQRIRAIG